MQILTYETKLNGLGKKGVFRWLGQSSVLRRSHRIFDPNKDGLNVRIAVPIFESREVIFDSTICLVNV